MCCEVCRSPLPHAAQACMGAAAGSKAARPPAAASFLPLLGGIRAACSFLFYLPHRPPSRRTMRRLSALTALAVWLALASGAVPGGGGGWGWGVGRQHRPTADASPRFKRTPPPQARPPSPPTAPAWSPACPGASSGPQPACRHCPAARLPQPPLLPANRCHPNRFDRPPAVHSLLPLYSTRTALQA